MFKTHFVAGLASTPPNFPLNLWDNLIPQALLTLNILRPTRFNPRLSAYAHVYGAFDNKRIPIAPLGINCTAHVTIALRKSWDLYAKEEVLHRPCRDPLPVPLYLDTVNIIDLHLRHSQIVLRQLQNSNRNTQPKHHCGSKWPHCDPSYQTHRHSPATTSSWLSRAPLGFRSHISQTITTKYYKISVEASHSYPCTTSKGVSTTASNS